MNEVQFLNMIIDRIMIARKGEFRYMLRITLIVMSMIGFALIFLDITWNIRIVISNITFGILCYGFSFVMTYRIVMVHRKRQQKTEQKTPEDRTESIPTRATLEQVLSTKRRFKLFADYLLKEFSIEHLFFLYQMMEIKRGLLASELIRCSYIHYFVYVIFFMFIHLLKM